MTNVHLYSMNPIPKSGWSLFLNAGEDRINLVLRLYLVELQMIEYLTL